MYQSFAEFHNIPKSKHSHTEFSTDFKLDNSLISDHCESYPSDSLSRKNDKNTLQLSLPKQTLSRLASSGNVKHY